MKTAQFKKRLEEEKVKLESEMGEIGRKNPAVPGDWEPVQTEMGVEADLSDQADVIVARDNESAIFSDLEAQYDTVVTALSRIEKGTYGICEVCGKKIEEDRLVANPAATTCVAHL